MEKNKPALTSDVVVVEITEDVCRVLLVKRKNPPYAGLWAFPGGFVEENETLEDAAKRELYEETSLLCESLKLIDVFSDPNRDPRERVVTCVYLCVIKERAKVEAGSDANEALWFDIDKLPKLAFDHEKIFDQALAMLRYHAGRIKDVLSFFPENITLKDLKKLI